METRATIEMKEYTLEELASNKKSNLCLVSIFGRIYNLNKFASQHPGGERVILQAAGDIIDDVFDDGNHRSIKDKVPTLLAAYQVGVLKK